MGSQAYRLLWTWLLHFYPRWYVHRGSKFCFVVLLLLGATLVRIHYCLISPCFQHIAPLPGSLLRQPCINITSLITGRRPAELQAFYGRGPACSIAYFYRQFSFFKLSLQLTRHSIAILILVYKLMYVN
jgi:hypothetical protein